MAPAKPVDCLTSFALTCVPANVSLSAADRHRLPMPIFNLESGPSYLLLLAMTSAVYVVMVFAMRLFLRLKVNGPFGKDDWACAVSTLFGLVYSVIAIVQVFLGFGSASRRLTPNEANTMAILSWVNSFCLTFASYFGKISACFLIARITKSREHLAVAYGLMVAVTMWLLQAQVYAVFQCKYPRPWDTSPRNICSDRWGHRFATAVSSWILEFAILAGAIHLVWNIKMSRGKKAKVIIAFSTRLLLIIPSASRLSPMHASVYNISPGSVVRLQVMTLFACQVSVISATVPCAKPFFSVFSSGIMGRPKDSILPMSRLPLSRSAMHRDPNVSPHQSFGRHQSFTMDHSNSINKLLAPERGITFATAEHVPDRSRAQRPSLGNSSKYSDRSITYAREVEVSFEDVGNLLGARDLNDAESGATKGRASIWRRTSGGK